MPTVPGLRRMIVADLPAAFELRAATRENRITLERLETDYGITIDGLAEAMRSDVAGWLVEKDGRVAAFAMGDRSNGEVQVVAVLPDHEGHGYGKAVLSAVVAWLFAEGHAEVWLYANRDPTLRASGFYRALGWAPTGAVRGAEEVLRLVRSEPTG